MILSQKFHHLALTVEPLLSRRLGSLILVVMLVAVTADSTLVGDLAEYFSFSTLKTYLNDRG